MSKLHVVSFVTLLCAGAASAQSLEEKQNRKAEDQVFADHVKETNQRCGSAISVSIDWKTWKSARDESKGYRAGASCSSAYYGINKVCSSDDGRASVAKTIKKIVCKGDGAETKVELAGDAFVIHTSFDAPTDAQKVTHEYLMKNLK